MSTARCCFALTLLLGSCASMMMTVNDRSGSDESVHLTAGNQVAVALPSLATTLDEGVTDAFGSSMLFGKALQTSLVLAFERAGVSAHPGDQGRDGTLKVHITAFGEGSGAGRFFLPGTGIGDSSLDGVATLVTPGGKRELEIRKTGSQSGAVEAGEQVTENIESFTTALVAALVK